MKKLLLVIMFLIPCSICSFWFKKKATFFIDKNISKNTKIGNKKPLLIADNIKSKNIDLNDYTSEGIYIFKDLVTSISMDDCNPIRR